MLPFRRTTAPPAGAGAVSVTVPVVLPSPRILADASVSDDRLAGGGGLPAGITVSDAEGARYPSSAVPESMTTRVATETGAVRTLNVAPVPAAGMKTLAGSAMTSLSPFTSDTSRPPGGAGFNSVTVPNAESPPITRSALSDTPQR